MATEAQLVQDDLRRKLRLEALLRPKVRSLFADMIKAHSASVKQTGKPLNAKRFQDDWVKLLGAHYEKVQKLFSGSVGETQKALLTGHYIKQDELTDEELAELTAAALLLWRTNQAKTQAQFITDTSVKNIDDAMDLAKEALDDEDMDASNAAVAATSARFLTRDFQGRTPSIVMTETQSAAESTKGMEVTALLGEDPMVVAAGGAMPAAATKKWKNVGDAKVRDLHVQANNQIRRLNEPFEIGGELLRFPGDSGLGATPKNTANCRCSALYRI